VTDIVLPIPCEGSGCLTHKPLAGHGRCVMCGRFVSTDGAGLAQPHERDDIIARLNRGDFDG
jgi:hypothetical protein